RYRLALAAAELASRRGAAFELAERHVEPSALTLRRLRRELGAIETSSTRPWAKLAPTFDRYVEAVLAASGYEIEATRARLDAGLERLLEPLLLNGALDVRSFEELFRTIPDETNEVPIASLVEAYRHAVRGIESTLHAPAAARQERNVRRALQFMREHLSEPLSLAQVARVAGFAPDHFSVLLKRELGKSFSLHLQGLRLERAKQLLLGTSLQVSRVAQLCGFKSRTSFQRLFRQSTATTPAEYQRRASGPASRHPPRAKR
ncbi:MAG TPA: AraC family transcriptional regulator, partial [Polyangiaceae bacterium]|nr:AraC family transcriptional regulator [Polyangiaceae bacterium]